MTHWPTGTTEAAAAGAQLLSWAPRGRLRPIGCVASMCRPREVRAGWTTLSVAWKFLPGVSPSTTNCTASVRYSWEVLRCMGASTVHERWFACGSAAVLLLLFHTSQIG